MTYKCDSCSAGIKRGHDASRSVRSHVSFGIRARSDGIPAFGVESNAARVQLMSTVNPNLLRLSPKSAIRRLRSRPEAPVLFYRTRPGGFSGVSDI
jgi:hypothetical protein